MNDQNLIPLQDRTPEDRKRIAQMGQKASVEKRKNNRNLLEQFNYLLDQKANKSLTAEYESLFEIPEDEEVKNSDILASKLIASAMIPGNEPLLFKIYEILSKNKEIANHIEPPQIYITAPYPLLEMIDQCREDPERIKDFFKEADQNDLDNLDELLNDIEYARQFSKPRPFDELFPEIEQQFFDRLQNNQPIYKADFEKLLSLPKYKFMQRCFEMNTMKNLIDQE